MSPVQYLKMPAAMDRSSSRVLPNGEGDTSSAVAVLEDAYQDLFRDCSDAHNAAIQNASITFAYFVETKFIPEHVQFKTSAGQTHYQAALKHLMTPEAVNRIFNPGRVANARLKSVPEWPYLDDVRLCDLNSDHVRRLISAANAADYSSQTVKHIKNVLFAVMSHAQREGCFNGPNPASQVKLPTIVRRKQHNLTFEQTKAVLRTLSSPLQEIAMFAITTGMNLGEICDLQWKHVNLSHTERMVDGEPIPGRTIAVRAPWNRAGLWNNRSLCKTRNIEIQEPLFSTLKQLSRRNQNVEGNARVIVSDEGAPILPASVKTALSRQFAKASGLPWLTWRILRRARSSFFAECLSQLSAFHAQDERPNPVSQFESSEGHCDKRVAESAPAFDSYRRRAFCFGLRKQEGSAMPR